MKSLSTNFILIFCALLLIPADWLIGQEQDFSQFENQIITKIVIVGNKHTKDRIILREMKTKVGDVFHADAIERDRKRIQNLLLFTRVEIYPARSGEKQVGLIIMVSERWNFFPYPLFFRNERSWDKWSYGAGLMHNNIRGLNNKVLTELWLGYNPGGMFSYVNPWFGGDRMFYYKLLVYSMRIKSRTLQISPRFYEQHNGFSFTFGKRYGYNIYASAMVGYDYVRFPSEYKSFQPSEAVGQHAPMFGLGFRYDTRDLYEYPRSGWYVEAYVKETTFPKQLDYQQVGVDLRRYVKLYKQVSLGFRGMTDLSRGTVPLFARMFIGYKERVRGQFFDQIEGENRALGSMELRFPIVPIRYIDLDYPSMLLGNYARNLPFGISGGIFIDSGIVWSQRGGTDPQSLFGFGAGLHFHVPYADVLRLEYAFNPQWEGQLIIDIEASF